MWEQQVYGISKFDDIPIQESRHPIIKKLEASLLNEKPKNSFYFIKKWAQKQLKELQQSGQEEEEHRSLSPQMKKQQKEKINIKRRNAIVMAQSQQTQQWIQFLNKQPLLKNEECKSKIMICLRKIPFLVNLGWDDINQLVQQAQIRQYYRNEVFVSKGQPINRLYILIQGQITANSDGRHNYSEGQSLFVQSIISLASANQTLYIASETVWICGIQSFRIYQLIQTTSKRREETYQKILMSIGLFSCLDREQFYKLYCLIDLGQVKKPNEIIIEQNDPIDRLYIVLKGEFIFCKKSLGGQITSFQSYREGQFFGQEWIIKPAQSEVMVISRNQGLLGIVHRKKFQQCITTIDRLLQRKKARKVHIL